MRLPSHDRLQRLRHTPPPVSRPLSYASLTVRILLTGSAGLQTPRLKRLAEIVSAQAIAQQEKLEYADGEGFDGQDTLAEVDEAAEAN